jgi:hypothetical protein
VRYKVVPEPRSPDFLAAVQRAVPLVPDDVEDCCSRVVADTDVSARDDARAWITFAEALELVEETDRGYRRVREPVDAETLAAAYRERVFGVREVLDALDTTGEPLSPGEVFPRVEGIVPRWERERYPDWESEWTERVERLLEWARLFGLVEQSAAGYTLTGGCHDAAGRHES